jgi:hypothetical protein
MDQGSGSVQLANAVSRLGIVPQRVPLYHGHYSEGQIREVVGQALKSHSPDLVHVFCGSPRSALVLREMAIAKSLPLVMTENYIPADLEIEEEKLRRIKRVYDQSFAVIYVCEENKRRLWKSFGLQCAALA